MKKTSRVVAVALLYLLVVRGFELPVASGQRFNEAETDLARQLTRNLARYYLLGENHPASQLERLKMSRYSHPAVDSRIPPPISSRADLINRKRATGSPSEALLKLMAEANSVADWTPEMADNMKLADRFQPMRG